MSLILKEYISSCNSLEIFLLYKIKQRVFVLFSFFSVLKKPSKGENKYLVLLVRISQHGTPHKNGLNIKLNKKIYT